MNNDRSLPFETLQRVELGGGETHSWSIDIPADHFVEVEAEQVGIDIRLRLLSPDGSQLVMDSPNGRWGYEKLAWVSEDGDRYILEVASEHTGAQAGNYEIFISRPRAASQKDRRHASALQLLCHGDALRRANESSHQEALLNFRSSLENWTAIGRDDWRLQSLQRIGQIQELLGDTSAAIDSYREAIRTAQAAEDQAEEARNHNRLARIALELRDTTRAGEHLARARTLAAGSQNPALSAAIESNVASLRFHEGDLEEAVRSYLELARTWRELEETLEEADALGNAGSLLVRQGQLGEAIEAFERSVELQAGRGSQANQTRALIRLGEARLRSGEPELALESLEEAGALGPENHLGQLWSAYFHNSLGLAMAEVDDPRAAEHFETASSLAQEVRDDRLAAICDFNLGVLLQRTGRSRDALSSFDTAAERFEDWGDQNRSAMVHLGRALALRELGELPEALGELEVAVELVETLRFDRASWGFRMWFLASKQRYFEELIDLLMELHLRGDTPASGPSFAARALQVTERRRARTFLDSIAEAHLRADIDPSMLEEERRLSEAMRRLTEELRGDGLPEEHDALQAERRQLLLAIEAVRGKIRKAHPQFGHITRPEPLDLGTVAGKVVGDGTQLLVFSLGDRRSFLWRIQRDRPLEVTVLEDRLTIESSVRAALDMVTTRSDSKAEKRNRSLRDLGRLLLGQVEAPAENARWAVVPDGILELVPWPALRPPWPAADDAKNAKEADDRFLVEEVEVVLLPSASSLFALRQESARRSEPAHEIAIFADPVYSGADDRLAAPNQESASAIPERLRRAVAESGRGQTLDRLPATQREGRAIAGLFLPEVAFLAEGLHARKDAEFWQRIQQTRFLHFATHGIVNRRQPELSALALSLVDEAGEPNDGFLYAYELYSQRLSAELVVLSACQTGVGPEVPGEGVAGLARAFMYAGAPRLVTSLWNVYDESTADLMVEFYEKMIGEGQTPSEALRTAQLRLLSSARTSEPYHWAAFLFFGDWLPEPHDRRDIAGPPIDQAEDGAGHIGPNADPVDFPDPDPPPYDRGDGNTRLAAGFDPDQYVNGLDLDSGKRLPPSPDGGSLLANGNELLLSPRKYRQLRWWSEHHSPDDPERLPIYGSDPSRLEESGWAVLWAPGVDDEVKEALEPLRHLRKHQADGLSQEHTIPSGMTSLQFRERFEIGFGAADPSVLPYYLLLVGNPAEIPFELQYDLDIQYAVGRLDLDSPDDYARYAETVCSCETGPRSRELARAAIFGVGGRGANEQYLIKSLVDPLYEKLCSWTEKKGLPKVERPEQSSKTGLRHLLVNSTPGLLFAAAHGLRCPPDHPEQALLQGALCCADPEEHDPLANSKVFSARDLGSDTDLRGMVAFVFSCFGAGVPEFDDFSTRVAGPRNRTARQPMVSGLAKRMLARGAQAFVGHVDRAWSTSFDWSSSEGNQVKVFESVLCQVMDGRRIGHSLEWINTRYAESAAEFNKLLTARLAPHGQGDLVARLRKAMLDARNYVLIGDPAVRAPGF